MSFDFRPYLKEISLKKERIEDSSIYPFSIPSLKNLKNLDFHEDVTFFVGENGSGKSTLIEAIAGSLRLNPEGGTRNTLFSSKNTHSELFEYLKIVRSAKTPSDLYFLRAESFYNVASYMDEVNYLQGYGGKSLHHQSHGESFMSALMNKFKGNGLYLLDEIESALSPSKQLAALSIIHQLVRKNSQFIIATHSPILLSYPNAKIYQFGDNGIKEVKYEETEHFEVTRNFLNQHEKMLKILMQ